MPAPWYQLTPAVVYNLSASVAYRPGYWQANPSEMLFCHWISSIDSSLFRDPSVMWNSLLTYEVPSFLLGHACRTTSHIMDRAVMW